MSFPKEIKDTLKKIDALREELKKAESSAAKEIMNVLKDLMKSNPLLVGMRWNQYTPYFNDGDACEFGINGPEFKFANSIISQEKISSEDDPDSQYLWFEGGRWGELDDSWFEKRTDVLNHKDIAALKKTVRKANEVFDKLSSMEEELESMFGDGVEITITADGVEIEDYDHD